jgi:signal transduction histidine kinase/putative methionine-R-sulfoxide reductase with GAF domain
MGQGTRSVKTEAQAKRPVAKVARKATGGEVSALKQRVAGFSEQQIAISEILQVIARSPGDLQPVLNAIVERALKLCSAKDATFFLLDGDRLRSVARFRSTPAPLEIGAFLPLNRGSFAGRAVTDRAVIHMEDAATAPEEEFPVAREMQVQQGHHAMLSVPLVRDDRAMGAITLWRTEIRPFTEKQISLVKIFADQAAIAIENVRLFKETKEALERESATSEILRVMSRSPTDMQTVFDTIATAALKLCGASSALVTTFDGELVHLAALAKLRPEGADAIRDAFPRLPSRETGATRAILMGTTVEIPDVLDDPEYATRVQALAGDFRSVLAVPLVRDDSPIGAISVGRPEQGPFAEKQIALLKTFADQAVIAIENTRLFNETKEALERQTVTSEILRVISRSPTDAQPVFDTIAKAALKLCRGNSANVVRFDGEQVHLAALANLTADGAEAIRKLFPRPPSRDIGSTRAVLTAGVVAIPDVLNDPDYALPPDGFRSVLAVPLLQEGRPIGAIGVGRAEPGLFPEKQVALLQTFADQAVIAIENVRLFKELEARTTELTRSVGELKALGEVGQAVSSTLDLETVLNTIVSRATQLAGMDGGAIHEYDESREAFNLRATYHLPNDLVDALYATPIAKGEGATGRLAVTREPVEIRDIEEPGAYESRVRAILLGHDYRSLLAVPLLRENHLLGGLVVTRSIAGAFAPEIVELLKTFATQSALAIQNARLFREIEQKSRELEAASRHKSEFLANMSHELRTPLNAIIGFSEVLSERMFGEINEKQAEYIGDILQSGQHLLSLINDILDLSKIEAGRMELDLSEFDLPGLVENTMTLVRERAIRRGIALGCSIDERLGTICADQRKVKQVLLNLLSNALKFTPESGNIEVQAAMRDSAAEISVTDTGVGIAPEDLATVFEEFRQVGAASKKVEGTGLGLAISRKFIELHGGRIWATSQPGTGSTFIFTLPLQEASAA